MEMTAPAKCRRRANIGQTVGGIEQVLSRFMAKRESIDLPGLLANISNLNEQSPQPAIIVEYGDLLRFHNGSLPFRFVEKI